MTRILTLVFQIYFMSLNLETFVFWKELVVIIDIFWLIYFMLFIYTCSIFFFICSSMLYCWLDLVWSANFHITFLFIYCLYLIFCYLLRYNLYMLGTKTLHVQFDQLWKYTSFFWMPVCPFLKKIILEKATSDKEMYGWHKSWLLNMYSYQDLPHLRNFPLILSQSISVTQTQALFSFL